MPDFNEQLRYLDAVARETGPRVAANTIEESVRLGLPPSVITSIKTNGAGPALSTYINTNPRLVNFALRNPLMASVGQDDWPKLAHMDDTSTLSSLRESHKQATLLGAFQQGLDTVEMANLAQQKFGIISGSEQLIGDTEFTEKDEARLQELQQRQRDIEASGILSLILKETVQTTPILFDVGVQAIAGAAAGAAAGSVTGPGAIAGAAYGAAVGGAKGAAELESALAMLEFAEEFKFDLKADGDLAFKPDGTITNAEAALTIALIVGAANGGLEVIGGGAILKAAPGVRHLVSSQLRKRIIKAAKEKGFIQAANSTGAALTIGRAAANTGGALLGEGTTEATQELNTVIGKWFAEHHPNESLFTRLEDESGRIIKAGKAGAAAGFGMSVGFNTMSAVSASKDAFNSAELTRSGMDGLAAAIDDLAETELDASPAVKQVFLQEIGADETMFIHPADVLRLADLDPVVAGKLGINKRTLSMSADLGVPISLAIDKLGSQLNAEEFATLRPMLRMTRDAINEEEREAGLLDAEIQRRFDTVQENQANSKEIAKAINARAVEVGRITGDKQQQENYKTLLTAWTTRMGVLGADALTLAQNIKMISSSTQAEFVEMTDRMQERINQVTSGKLGEQIREEGAALKSRPESLNETEKTATPTAITNDLGSLTDQGKLPPARGAATRLSDGSIYIGLFEQRKDDTLWHELGHVFGLEMQAFVNSGLAPDSVKADLKTVKEFIGIDELADLLDVDNKDIVRPQEKFANAFVDYLATGKAPTSKLKEAFARFKTWLGEIYLSHMRQVTAGSQDVAHFNGEIEAVMERLFASEVKVSESKLLEAPLQSSEARAALLEAGIAPKAMSGWVATMKSVRNQIRAKFQEEQAEIAQDHQAERVKVAGAAIDENVIFQTIKSLVGKPITVESASNYATSEQVRDLQRRGLVSAVEVETVPPTQGFTPSEALHTLQEDMSNIPKDQKVTIPKEPPSVSITENRKKGSTRSTSVQAVPLTPSNLAPTMKARLATIKDLMRRLGARPAAAKRILGAAKVRADREQGSHANIKSVQRVLRTIEKELTEAVALQKSQESAALGRALSAATSTIATPAEGVEARAPGFLTTDLQILATDLEMNPRTLINQIWAMANYRGPRSGNLRTEGQVANLREALIEDYLQKKVLEDIDEADIDAFVASTEEYAQALDDLSALMIDLAGKKSAHLRRQRRQTAEIAFATLDHTGARQTSRFVNNAAKLFRDMTVALLEESAPGKAFDLLQQAEIQVRLAKMSRTYTRFSDRGVKQAGKKTKKVKSIASRQRNAIKTIVHDYSLLPGMKFDPETETQNAGDLLDSTDNLDNIRTRHNERFMVPQAEVTDYKDLTVEEFTDMMAVLDVLAFRGANEVKLILEGKEIDRQGLVNDMLEQSGSLKGRPDNKEGGLLNRADELMDQYRGGLSTLTTTMQDMDGNTRIHGGAKGLWERTIIDPIRRAMSRYQRDGTRIKNEYAKLHEVHYAEAKLYPNQILKSADGLRDLAIPPVFARTAGVHWQWTYERILELARHRGTDYNYSTALKGYELNDQQYNDIVSNISPASWDAIQGTWDLLSQDFDEVNQVHLRREGFLQERVVAAEFTIDLADGTTKTLTGGYYPLNFDSQAIADIAQAVAENFDALSTKAAMFGAPINTKSGFLERRQAEATSLPILLNGSVLARHIADKYRYLHLGEVTEHAWSVLRDKRVESEIKRVLGNEHWANVRKNLAHIARPDSGGLVGVERHIDWMARATTLAILGANVSVSLKQWFSTPGGINEIGMGAYIDGARTVYGRDFIKMRDTMYAFSPFMRDRATSFDRDLPRMASSLRRIGTTKVGRVANEITPHLFVLIRMLDQATVMPLWFGAYNKQLTAGKTQEEAIAFADEAIEISQPTNRPMDTSVLQRSKGWFRLFSLFSTFTLKFGHRQRATYRRYVNDPEFGLGQASTAYMLEGILPALAMHALFSNMIWGEEFDDEDLVDAGVEVLTYQFIGMPVVRDLVGGVEGKVRNQPWKGTIGTPLSAGPELVANAIATPIQWAMELDDDEKAEKTLWSIANVVAFAYGIPAPKVLSKLKEGFVQFGEEEEFRVGSLVQILAPSPTKKGERK